MNYDLSYLDLDSLKSIYDKEVDVLKQRLLDGYLWDEMQDQRDLLNQLSIAMYEKVQATNHSSRSGILPAQRS